MRYHHIELPLTYTADHGIGAEHSPKSRKFKKMAMISRLKMTLAVCLALTPVIAPSMSLAQDAAAPAAPAAATPAAPLTKETAAIGQIYVASKSDPWETRCTKTDGAKDPCQLFQLLRDEKGGAVAEVNLFGVLPGGLSLIHI
jgi:invasion protein IalB